MLCDYIEDTLRHSVDLGNDSLNVVEIFFKSYGDIAVQLLGTRICMRGSSSMSNLESIMRFWRHQDAFLDLLGCFSEGQRKELLATVTEHGSTRDKLKELLITVENKTHFDKLFPINSQVEEVENDPPVL
jgi:hypothetical protein